MSFIIKNIFLSLWFFHLILTAKKSKLSKFKLARPVNSIGGQTTKSHYLNRYCKNWSETFNVLICLSGSPVPLFLLRYLKARGVKILVIQNGVYYPLWFPQDWKIKNAYLKNLNQLSDHTFFQSNFALESYRNFVYSPPCRHSILFNGVDQNIFRPHEATNASEFNILLFLDIKRDYQKYWDFFEDFFSKNHFEFNIKLNVIGNNTDRLYLREVKCLFENLAVNTEVFDNLSLENISIILPRNHCMVHIIHNDVCPNKVIEAMSCGVPVIGVNSGGTPEIIGDPNLILNTTLTYEQISLPDSKELYNKLLFIRSDHDKIRRAVISRSKRFNLFDWFKAIEKNV